MTLIAVNLRTARGPAGRVTIKAAPTTRVAGDAFTLLPLEATFTVAPRDLAAEATGQPRADVIDLPSNLDPAYPGQWAWHLREIGPTGARLGERTVNVPVSVGTTPVAYSKLVEVNPADLLPSAKPGPAWDAALADLQTQLDAATGLDSSGAATKTELAAAVADVPRLVNGKLALSVIPDGIGGGVTPGQAVQLAQAAKGVATGQLAMSTAIQDAAPQTLYSTQNPAAEFCSETNRTYLAYLGASRNLYVTYFDHALAQWGEGVYAGEYVIDDREDTHGAPSLTIDPVRKRVVVVYGNHNQAHAVARSGANYDVTSWSVVRPTPIGSYGTITFDPTSAALWLAFRAGDGHGATYPTHEYGSLLKSVDGGATWSDVGWLVNTKVSFPSDAASDWYMSDCDAVNGRVYLSWAIAHGTRHDGPRANVHVAYFDTASATMRTAAGVSLGAKIDTEAKMAQCRILAQDFVYPVKTAVSPAGQVLTVFNRYNPSPDLVEVTTAYHPGTAGGAWTVRNTGVTSNYLYHGVSSAWRDGRWEVGCVRLLGGDRTVAQTSQADIIPGASAGGDLVVLVSQDGTSWEEDSRFARERFLGGGCQYLQAVRNPSPDLVMLAQAISLGPVADSATGSKRPGHDYNTPSWTSNVYAIYSRATLPRLVGVAPRPEQVQRLDPYYKIVDRASPPTSWTTVDLAGLVPQGTTTVVLKVVVTGTGTAGANVISFREGTTSRSSDAQISPRGEWTDAMVYDVEVPLSPLRTFQWQCGTAGRSTVTLYPRAVTVGTTARSSGAGVAPPPPVKPPVADTTAPSTPGTPVATAGPGSASATTSGSTDNVGVTGYRWYRGTTLAGTSTGKTFSETGLAAGAAVAYTVEALDAAGNVSTRSAASNSVTPTAAGSGTPETVAFTDGFNRADSSGGGFGNGWTVANGSSDGSVVSANQASSSYGGSAATKQYRPPTVPSTPNQWAQVTVAARPSSTSGCPDPHVLLRATRIGATSGVSCYTIRYNASNGAAQWQMYRIDAGNTTTPIKTFDASAPAEGYVLRAEIDSTNTIRVKVNGAIIPDLTYTDATPVTGGVPCLAIRSTGAGDDKQRADDFSCGDLAAA